MRRSAPCPSVSPPPDSGSCCGSAAASAAESCPCGHARFCTEEIQLATRRATVHVVGTHHLCRGCVARVRAVLAAARPAVVCVEVPHLRHVERVHAAATAALGCSGVLWDDADGRDGGALSQPQAAALASELARHGVGLQPHAADALRAGGVLCGSEMVAAYAWCNGGGRGGTTCLRAVDTCPVRSDDGGRDAAMLRGVVAACEEAAKAAEEEEEEEGGAEAKDAASAPVREAKRARVEERVEGPAQPRPLTAAVVTGALHVDRLLALMRREGEAVVQEEEEEEEDEMTATSTSSGKGSAAG